MGKDGISWYLRGRVLGFRVLFVCLFLSFFLSSSYRSAEIV